MKVMDGWMDGNEVPRSPPSIPFFSSSFPILDHF